MQTSFAQEFLQTPDGQRVNDILRACVHCGFCNATCPTYQLTGNELDGPRGRIYLIKNFFEEKNSSTVSMQHLDRCLTCLSCETTCPSGVEYGNLVDIGRKHMEKSIKRTIADKVKRRLIIEIFSTPRRAAISFSMARLLKLLLPFKLAKKVPAKPVTPTPVLSTGRRKLMTIKGCVQSSVAPQINAAASRILSRSNIQLDETESDCCGALAFHLTDIKKAKKTIRKNIDSWYQKLSDSYEYLAVSSSGCSHFIKQYRNIMRADRKYAEKAEFVSAQTHDLAEITAEFTPDESVSRNSTVAFHSPCTLQHGQKVVGNIEATLQKAGYRLAEVQDSHLCCGSAGSYSLLETGLSTRLLQNKIATLEEKQPDVIATANIGCLMHLQSATKTPVKHWVELLDQTSVQDQLK